MLYKRSSFLSWLREKHSCEILPIRGTNVIVIKNGTVDAKMWLDKKDRIDYEEIWLLCNKLYIDGLPGNAELEKTG